MMGTDPPKPGGAALRLYEGYRYRILTFINSTEKLPTAEAELWWQRRLTRLCRAGPTAGATLPPPEQRPQGRSRVGFKQWIDGRLKTEGSGR